MIDSQDAGFGKFIPGFDFLQNLAKGASGATPQMPNMANWIAPTLNVEELDKRISELKTVQFWLDQNSKALSATVQALEVQKMTLATLKGMNFNINEMANALKPKPAEAASAPKAPEKAAAASKTISEMAAEAEEAAKKADKPAQPAAAAAAAGLVDPMQLWGSLTQQFQQIAASAMKDVSQNTAMDMTKNMAAGFAKEAAKVTEQVVASASVAKAAKPPKAPAKKAAKKTTGSR